MKFENLKKSYIYLIGLFPFFSYFCISILNISPIILLVLISIPFLIIIYDLNNGNLSVPHYIKFILLFGLYYYLLVGYKYRNLSLLRALYTNSYFRVSIVLLVLENLKLSKKNILTLTQILSVLLVLGMIASILQLTVDPSLFTNVSDSSILIKNSSQWKYIEAGRHPSIYGLIGGDAISRNLPFIFSIVLSMFIYKKKNSRKFLYSFLVGLSFIISRWRIALLQYFLVLLQFVKVRKNKLGGVLLILILLTVTFFVLYFFIENYIDLDFDTLFIKRLTSTSGKTRVWAFHLFDKFFWDNPIFGTGGLNSQELQNTIQDSTYGIHVGYLSILYYYGIIGGVLFFLINYSIIKELSQTMRKTNFLGSYFGFLAFLALNLTDFNFSFFHMGFFLCIIYNKYYREDFENKVDYEKK